MGIPQAVFFDLDGTLLDHGAEPYPATVRRACLAAARSIPGLDADRLCAAYLALHTARPDRSWGGLWGEALAACGYPDDAVVDRVVAIFVDRRRRNYRVFDDGLRALTQLRDRGDRLALITNGPADAQRDKVGTTGLGAFFDAVIISGEVGVAKPDKAIFDLAAAAVRVPLESACHVGDTLAIDVAGGLNAGLHAAIWLNRHAELPGPGTPTPDHEIVSLDALLPLLEVR